MFEGHAIHAAFEEAGEETALRRLDWSDLVEKLAAARDLRAVLASPADGGMASFGRGAAHYFAAAGDGKPEINHEALFHRKSAECKAPCTPRTATDGDREI